LPRRASTSHRLVGGGGGVGSSPTLRRDLSCRLPPARKSHPPFVTTCSAFEVLVSVAKRDCTQSVFPTIITGERPLGDVGI
jgi:hypothetical protein